MNEIVKYDNYMNSLKFSSFTTVDLNFFMTLCSRMREKGTRKICLSFEELRELTNYKKSNSVSQFASDLEKMNEKLIKVTCKLRIGSETIMFVLFPTFRINEDEQTLTVSVNEDFKFILNEITKNFTRFELNEFVHLDSKYSKNIYRLLKQFRTTGKYEVSIQDFREKVDCPESYSAKYVMDLIIKPSLKELSSYFQDLRCEAKYARKRGRPVIGYIFTFTPEAIKNDTEQHGLKSKNMPDKKKSTAGNRLDEYRSYHQRTYDYENLEKQLAERTDRSVDSLSNEDLEKIKNLLNSQLYAELLYPSKNAD